MVSSLVLSYSTLSRSSICNCPHFSNGLEFSKLLYLGVEVTCWVITGERQAARIRSLYLKTILRQDIPFFDQETTTGEVISRMSGDTILIQDAIGEKVLIFTWYLVFI